MTAHGSCSRCGNAFEECPCQNEMKFDPTEGLSREPQVIQKIIVGELDEYVCATCASAMEFREKHVVLAFTWGQEVKICRFCCSKINRVAQKTDI